MSIFIAYLREKADAERIIAQIGTITAENEKNYVDSVLQVAVQENEEIFNKIREEGKMCEALMKLMEPEVNEVVDKAVKCAEDKKRKI